MCFTNLAIRMSLHHSSSHHASLARHTLVVCRSKVKSRASQCLATKLSQHRMYGTATYSPNSYPTRCGLLSNHIFSSTSLSGNHTTMTVPRVLLPCKICSAPPLLNVRCQPGACQNCKFVGWPIRFRNQVSVVC